MGHLSSKLYTIFNSIFYFDLLSIKKHFNKNKLPYNLRVIEGFDYKLLYTTITFMLLEKLYIEDELKLSSVVEYISNFCFKNRFLLHNKTKHLLTNYNVYKAYRQHLEGYLYTNDLDVKFITNLSNKWFLAFTLHTIALLKQKTKLVSVYKDYHNNKVIYFIKITDDANNILNKNDILELIVNKDSNIKLCDNKIVRLDDNKNSILKLFDTECAINHNVINHYRYYLKQRNYYILLKGSKSSYIYNSLNKKKVATYLSKITHGLNYLVDKNTITQKHSFCYRGRVYVKNPRFSVQGDKIFKSCLSIPKGLKLKREGILAFLEYGSSLFNDKETDVKTFDNKYGSVLTDLLNPSNDPDIILQGNIDNIYPILNFAFEYEKFLNGDNVSMLIPIDANISMLQQVAGITHSKSLMYKCNMFNNNNTDMYNLISKDIKKELGYSLTRKQVKEFVIPILYGVSILGIKKIYCSIFQISNKDYYDNRYTINKVLQTIIKLIKKHIKEIDYIKDVLHNNFKNDKGFIEWTLPNNFNIKLNYYKREKIRIINTTKKISITCKVDTNKYDYRKMYKSLLANFIHSLDSYLLQSIISNLPNTYKLTAHDSIFIHPNDVDYVKDICTNTYINIYSNILPNYLGFKKFLLKKNKVKTNDWDKISNLFTI